jgi:hypothetical protein
VIFVVEEPLPDSMRIVARRRLESSASDPASKVTRQTMNFRQLARRIHHFLEIYGLDGQKFVTSVRNTPHFLRTLSAYRTQSQSTDRFPLRAKELAPILHEFSDPAGSATGHYFYQDLWAARKVYAAQRPPSRHRFPYRRLCDPPFDLHGCDSHRHSPAAL